MASARIYACAWGPPPKHRITATKKRATEKMKVWKRWKERQGLTTTKSKGVNGYIARKDGVPVEACAVHEYDVMTKERLA